LEFEGEEIRKEPRVEEKKFCRTWGGFRRKKMNVKTKNVVLPRVLKGRGGNPALPEGKDKRRRRKEF